MSLEEIFDDTYKKVTQYYLDSYEQGYTDVESGIMAHSLTFLESVILPVLDAYKRTDQEVYQRKLKSIAQAFRLTIRRLMPWDYFCELMNLDEMRKADELIDQYMVDTDGDVDADDVKKQEFKNKLMEYYK